MSIDRPQPWYIVAPAWPAVPALLDVARSTPAKVVSRLVFVVTSFAWCLVWALLLLAFFAGAFGTESHVYRWALGTDLVVDTLVLYVGTVSLRIIWRLVRPRVGPREPLWLKILDEMGFPAWSMVSTGQRFFAWLHLLGSLPRRLILSNYRRAIRIAIGLAIVVVAMLGLGLIIRIIFPMRTLYWGNGWASGVRMFGTGTWLLGAVIVVTVVAVFVLLMYATYIAQALWSVLPYVFSVAVLDQLGIHGLDWINKAIMWTPQFVQNLETPDPGDPEIVQAAGVAAYKALHPMYPLDGSEMSLIGFVLFGFVTASIPMTVRRLGMTPTVHIAAPASLRGGFDVPEFEIESESAKSLDVVALHHSRPAFGAVAVFSAACMAAGILSMMRMGASDESDAFGLIVALLLFIVVPAAVVFLINYLARPKVRSELMNHDGLLIWEARARDRRESETSAPEPLLRVQNP